MLPTPSTSHVPYDRVYEPSEDSYLMLDTLSSHEETGFLKEHFSSSPTPLVCEVGTGSGVVLAFIHANATRILGRSDVVSVGVDINHFACSATVQTVEKAGLETSHGDPVRPIFLGGIHGDLLSSLKPASVDMLVFNPPYVPAPLPDPALVLEVRDAKLTSDEIFERDGRLLALSYAGGEEGMEVTNRLLAQIPGVLTRRGVAYILLCAQNKPGKVMDRIQNWEGGWCVRQIADSGAKAGWERLSIIRIWRPRCVA